MERARDLRSEREADQWMVDNLFEWKTDRICHIYRWHYKRINVYRIVFYACVMCCYWMDRASLSMFPIAVAFAIPRNSLEINLFQKNIFILDLLLEHSCLAEVQWTFWVMCASVFVPAAVLKIGRWHFNRSTSLPNTNLRAQSEFRFSFQFCSG